MPAATDTYRPFRGKRPLVQLPFLPLAAEGIRTTGRRKLVVLLVYLLPALWTVVFSFQVYTKFALETGSVPGMSPGMVSAFKRQLASQLISVRESIAECFTVSCIFAFLVAAWAGAGLLADDRRRGAHLLLFARPITRVDYLVGRFLVVFFYSAMSVLVPGLIVCATAAFSSPEWSFVREESHVIAGTLLYGLMVPAYLSLLVLAVSSLSSRKAFALLGAFGCVALPHAMSWVMRNVMDGDESWRVISPYSCMARVAAGLLDFRQPIFEWPVRNAVFALGGVMAACVVVLAWRVKKLEVVA